MLQFDDVQSEAPTFDPDGTSLQSMFAFAESFYEDVFEDEGANTTVTINYWYEDLTGLLGLHNVVAQGGTPNRETGATIQINTKVGSGGAEQNYFFDPTPEDNGEFDMQPALFHDLVSADQTSFFTGSVPLVFEVGFIGTANPGPAQGVTDMLTLVLHELGHALGMSASNDATIIETTDGDYDVDPLFVGGATMGVRYSSDRNIAHLADNHAALFPAIPNNARHLPSATDLLSMASGHGYIEVDLPRKNFLASASNHWEPARWTGNRNPDIDDDAFVRSPDVDPIVQLMGPSQARTLVIAEGDQLVTNAHALEVREQITVYGAGTTLTVNDVSGSITADALLVDKAARLVVAGGVASAASVTLTAGGQIDLSAGRLAVGQLDLTGGTLIMTGGSLNADGVEGDFQMQGGLFSLSQSPGQTVIHGAYSQSTNSMLGIELNGPVVGTDYDQLLVSDTAVLAGTLGVTTGFTPITGVSPGVIGQTFAIVTHGGSSGSFETVVGSHGGSGIFYDVDYNKNDVTLGAWQALPGDSDGDRDVDVTDFNVLSDHFDTTGSQHTWVEADFDGDRDVDLTDFDILAANFIPGGYGGGQSSIAVPEPAAFLAALVGFLLLAWSTRKRNLWR